MRSKKPRRWRPRPTPSIDVAVQPATYSAEGAWEMVASRCGCAGQPMTLAFFEAYQKAVLQGITCAIFQQAMLCLDAACFDGIDRFAKGVVEAGVEIVIAQRARFRSTSEPGVDDEAASGASNDKTKTWGSSGLLARTTPVLGVADLSTIPFKLGVMGFCRLGLDWVQEFKQAKGLGEPKGKRQMQHAERILVAFAMLLINLLNCVHKGREEHRRVGVSISLTNGWYVLPAAWGPRLKALVRRKEMSEAIDFLEAGGWLVKRRGFHDPKTGKGRRTILIPTEKLVTEMIKLGRSDVVIEDWYPTSTVILRDVEKKPVAFKPTDETSQMEAELKAINAFNTGHFILPAKLDNFTVVNPFVFHRVFSRGSLRFDLGGRLFAPFLNLHQEERLQILCDGEGVVELDYGGIHIRFAYAECGIDYGTGDPYGIAGVPFTRKEVKIALNIVLNARTIQSARAAIKANVEERRRRVAHEIVEKDNEGHEEGLNEEREAAEQRVRWPSDSDITALIEALKHKHTAVAHYFHADVGLRLQRKDSEIALRVIAKMQAQGLSCLSVHDSFICQTSKEAELRKAMEEAYEVTTGCKPVVDKKGVKKK